MIAICLQQATSPCSSYGGSRSDASTTVGVRSDTNSNHTPNICFPSHYVSIPFPFLVLLVSGGHCILAVAEAPGNFKRLGQTKDDSPGEAFDKVARWMCLQEHHEVPPHLPGGAAIEMLAKRGNPDRQDTLPPDVMMRRYGSIYTSVY